MILETAVASVTQILPIVFCRSFSADRFLPIVFCRSFSADRFLPIVENRQIVNLEAMTTQSFHHAT